MYDMRLLDIVKTTLATDKLKLDEEMERVINDKGMNTEVKVNTVKELLNLMVLSELSFKKWETFFDEDKDKDKIEK